MSDLPDSEDTRKRLLASRRTAKRLRTEYETTGDTNTQLAAMDAEAEWVKATMDYFRLRQAGVEINLPDDEPGSTMLAPSVSPEKDL